MSWVTTSNVFRFSRTSASSKSITAPPARESRLPVGSSAKMMLGSLINARAMATRCCSPPESSTWQVVHPVAEADLAQRLRGPLRRSAPGDHCGKLDVLEGSQLGQQEVALEDEPHALVAQPGLGAPVELVDGIALEDDRPCRRPLEARERVEQRRLPGARCPNEEHCLRGGDFQLDAAQDLQLALADAERLAQAAGADQWRAGWLRASRWGKP